MRCCAAQDMPASQESSASAPISTDAPWVTALGLKRAITAHEKGPRDARPDSILIRKNH
jgi:hypothetical protein